jgi:hypothetical protein
MATRKYKRRTHSNKHKKNQSKKRRPRKHRGGCGHCGASMNGGNAHGAVPGPEAVPIRYYYGLNDHMQDPNNPSAVVDARLTGGNGGNGGKQRKQRKQRGGFSYVNTDMILGSTAYNVPGSFGSHVQAPLAYGLLSGTTSVNPSTYVQPIETKYNGDNPPLA